jgi:hypothetical protein
MMRGIRRLVVCTAVSGLLAAGAVGATMQVAHADNFAAACGGNGSNGYRCNLDTVVPASSSITVTVDSGAASEQLNVSWTVACSNGANSGNEEGATDNAATPINGSCNVNAGISLPAHDVTPKIDYTGTLTYTPAGSTSSSSAVHPVESLLGKCVDDKGNSSANGTAIVIWSCSGSDQAENWKLSNGEFVHNGKCLNDKASGGSGSKVILYSCNGGSNEKWSELANGELKLQAHGGTLCLDDPRSSTKNGTQLIVYRCSGNTNQKWSLP